MKCNCTGKWIVLQFIEKFVVTSATYNCPTTHTNTYEHMNWMREERKNRNFIQFALQSKEEKKESISFSVCGNLTLFGNFATISFGKYWRMASRNTAYSTLIQWQRRMETPTFYTIAFGRKIKRENKERKKNHSMANPIKQFDRLFQKQKPKHSEEVKKKRFVCWSTQRRWFSWDAISHRIDELQKF